mmetsp:Transcript_75764/g.245268  ORF Transcript_75764/g.245268 Transcript_75764/m.245268 type:complete len:201 (-) Transcript_75764:330-932(-)
MCTGSLWPPTQRLKARGQRLAASSPLFSRRLWSNSTRRSSTRRALKRLSSSVPQNSPRYCLAPPRRLCAIGSASSRASGTKPSSVSNPDGPGGVGQWKASSGPELRPSCGCGEGDGADSGSTLTSSSLTAPLLQASLVLTQPVPGPLPVSLLKRRRSPSRPSSSTRAPVERRAASAAEAISLPFRTRSPPVPWPPTTSHN